VVVSSVCPGLPEKSHSDVVGLREDAFFDGDLDRKRGELGKHTRGQVGGEGLNESAGLLSGDLLQTSGDVRVVDGVNNDIGMQELRRGTFLVRHADVAAELEIGEVDLVGHGQVKGKT
jgi:hypothetical protein